MIEWTHREVLLAAQAISWYIMHLEKKEKTPGRQEKLQELARMLRSIEQSKLMY